MIEDPKKAGLPVQHLSSNFIFCKNADFFVYPNNLNHYAKYYKNTIQNYPEIIIRDNHFKEKVDNLFLDLNCAIHPCCAGKTDINERKD